jgi:sporulation protein YabP
MPESTHKLLLEGRKVLEISGVTAVESFDNERIELTTNLGGLDIGGEGLMISALDLANGQVAIGGLVNSLQYGKTRAEKSARHKRKNMLERLLK